MGFDIMKLASKAVDGISKQNGKRLQKKYAAPKIPESEPITLKGERYECGFASVEVMPLSVTDRFYGIAGHGTGRAVEGVHDPLTVSALWIGCAGGGIVMVAADLIGLTNTEVKKIRASLDFFSAKTGCKSINICCSHTHGSLDTVGYWGKLPKTGKDEAYMNLLFAKVKEVVTKAYENRVSGKLYVGTTHVPDAQYIRFEPRVYHDVLTRFRFVPDNGSAETWFINFAAHPNTLGGENRLVSADYPYYLRETIKKEKPVNVMFGVGAIGAVDPGMYSKDRPERTRLQGEALAKAALSVTDETELQADITVLCQPFYCPVDNTVLNFLSLFHVMSCDKYPYDKGHLKMALKTEMTYIKLGNQQILLLPGEPLPPICYGGYRDKNHSATGQGPEINPEPLVKIADDENLLIFGVTNDMTGYAVTPNEFVLNADKPYLDVTNDRFGFKHYQETNSLGPLVPETMAEVFRSIMQRVKRV